MSDITEILKKVSEVPDYAGITNIGPNTLGNFNTRPLHVVAVWGDCEKIKTLVSAGADINSQGEHGFTPLMEAIAQGNKEACVLLVSLGAKPIPDNEGNKPSAYAGICEEENIARWLTEIGY